MSEQTNFSTVENFLNDLGTTNDVAIIRTALTLVADNVTKLTSKVNLGGSILVDVVYGIDDIMTICDCVDQYKLATNDTDRNAVVGEAMASSIDIVGSILCYGFGVPGVAFAGYILTIAGEVLRGGINVITNYTDQLDQILYEAEGGNPNYYDLQNELESLGADSQDIEDLISSLEALERALNNAGADTSDFKDDLNDTKSNLNSANDIYDKVSEKCSDWINETTDKTKENSGEDYDESGNTQPPKDPLIIDLTMQFMLTKQEH